MLSVVESSESKISKKASCNRFEKKKNSFKVSSEEEVAVRMRSGIWRKAESKEDKIQRVKTLRNMETN